MKFEDLDLNDGVLDALYDMRFEDCTPIQEKCIPEILAGRDVLGVAQTGTGKTAAYLLPILSKLADGGYADDKINCVIMSPTRELAQQIDQAMQGFAYYLDGVSSVAVYGGNDGNRYDQELKSLQLGADVVIATPGRFISHISLGNVDLSQVSFFVLDEADRMLDMGFSEDIMTIAKKLPKTCQTVMFSATMPKKIEDLAKTLLHNPVEVKLAVSKPAEKIHQMAYICHETQKLGIIKDVFKNADLKRVIIFCGSKMKVKQVAGALQRMKIKCGEMHSDLEQSERDDMMFKFKSGQIDVLVATDILARGIDIDDIAMVINYDVPHDCEDYVHRIGRTARADRDGRAITFVNEDDMYAFSQVEKFLDKEITKNPLPEGCGEGPEYVTSKRKASAKSNRRKDRDATSHKANKQRNRRNTRKDRQPKSEKQAKGEQQPMGDQQAENGSGKQQGEKAGAEKNNANKRRNNRRQQKPQGEQAETEKRNENGASKRRNEGDAPTNRNEEGAPEKKQNRRRRGNNKQAKPQGEQQAAPEKRNDNNKSAKRNEGEQKNNNKQRSQKPRRRRQQQEAEAPTVGRTTRYNGLPDDFKAPEEHESGLKKLIKRPLKWIKSIGKK